MQGMKTTKDFRLYPLNPLHPFYVNKQARSDRNGVFLSHKHISRPMAFLTINLLLVDSTVGQPGLHATYRFQVNKGWVRSLLIEQTGRLPCCRDKDTLPTEP